MARAHVIGAGMAGLAAAVSLAEQGIAVTLHEAAGHAGGRCRSFHDSVTDRWIDNGNHLVLSGNYAAMTFLDTIGAADTMCGPTEAAFPFVDLEHDLRWTLRPDKGAVPWSILSAARRVPGTSLTDYLAAWRLARAGAEARVGDCLDTTNALWRRFWAPVVVSILNTDPAEASAALLWAVLRETFGKGAAACRPMIARRGLGDSFVAPALAFLENHGVEIRFNSRVRALRTADGHAIGLDGGGVIEFGAGDAVVLAVPPPAAKSLLPEITVPDRFEAIVNGHFVLPRALGDVTFMGIVGATAEWLFVRGDVVSTTVSAASALAAQSDDALADALWSDIRRVLDLGDLERGNYRIIREKRATISQAPADTALRPPAKTALANLWLAGDWTDTGLPATIEGAIRSGRHAADALLRQMRDKP